MLKLPCICFILSLTIYNLQASSTDDPVTPMQWQAADALLSLSYAPNQALSSITVPIPSIPSTIPMEEEHDTPQGTTTHSTYLPPFLAACDHIIQQTAGIQTSEYYLQRAAYIKEHYTKHKSTHNKKTLTTICEAHHKSKSGVSEAIKTLVYEPTLRSMMEDKCYLWEIAWVLGMKDHAVRKGINVYLNNCGEGKLFDSINADIAELYRGRSHTYNKKSYESKGPPKAFIEEQVCQQISEGKDNREIKVPGVLYNKLYIVSTMLRQSHDDASSADGIPLTEATPSAVPPYIQNLFPEKDGQGRHIKNPEAFKEMDNAYREFLITRLENNQHSWTEFKKHMEEQGIWNRLIRKGFIREQIYIYFYNHLEIPSDIDPSLPVISRSTVKDFVKTKFRDQAECGIGKILESLLAHHRDKQLYAGIKRDIENTLASAKRAAVQSGLEDDNTPTQSTHLPPFLATCDHITQQTAYIQTGEYYLQRAAYIKEHYAKEESTHNKETLTTICTELYKSGGAISKAMKTLVYEPTIRSMMEDKCYLWEIAWVLDMDDRNVRNGINVYLNNCSEGKLFDSIDADIAELYSERSHTYKGKKYESKGPPKAFIEDQVRKQISEGKDNSEIKVPGVLYNKLNNLAKMLRQSYDDAALTAAVPLAEATPSAIPPYIHNLFPEKDRSVGGSYMQNPEAFMEMDNAYREFLITRLGKQQHSWKKFKRHMEEQGIWDRLISKNFRDRQIYIHFYNHLEIPCDIDPSLLVISRGTVKDVVKTNFRDKAECHNIIQFLLADHPNEQLYAGIKGDINNTLESAKRSAAQRGTQEERGESLAKKATINRNSDDSSQQTLSPVPTENTSLSTVGLNDATDNVSLSVISKHEVDQSINIVLMAKSICSIDDVITYLTENYPNKKLYAGIKKDIRKQLFRKRGKKPAVQSTIASINNDATDNVSPMPLENHLGSAKRSIYNSPSACLAAKSNTADEEDEHGESLAKKAKQ